MIVIHRKIRQPDLTPQQKKEAENLFQTGLGANSIALKLGVKTRPVTKHLAERGMRRTPAEAYKVKAANGT